MSIWQTYIFGLFPITAIACSTWLLSLRKRDVSIVDGVWSLLLWSAGVTYVVAGPPLRSRALLILTLLTVWAVRLAVYITARNWGEPEDRRYQQIRARNQPNFDIKSLYLVFLLQALLAWIISLPLLCAASADARLIWPDYLGGAIVVFGILFESIGDRQMARFKSDPANRGQVMDRGLWRYTRHPNYFGECCVWWGFYVIALAANGWWSLPGPLLITILLLRVSGVALLEKDIADRRPAYRLYMQRTNSFIPGRPRQMMKSAADSTSD